MLIEIHLLQNHAPSNLNRDDTGSPKDCVFGGVKRARISSQCLKRSIRCGPFSPFRTEMEEHLSLRTKDLASKVSESLRELDCTDEEVSTIIAKVPSLFTKEKAAEAGPSDDSDDAHPKSRARKGDDDGEDNAETAQLVFFHLSEARPLAEALLKLYRAPAGQYFKKNKKPIGFAQASGKDIAAAIRDKLKCPSRARSVDIAMFGRMVTSAAFEDVQASMQVAHAMSTHRVDTEFDYFTAVDDLSGEAGAGHIGDVEFNSACYYKYFSIDLGGLVDNLTAKSAGRKDIPAEEQAEAKAVAISAVEAFLKSAVAVTPTGKQNTFAAHQLPAAVLVEARPTCTPVSYANAFVEPARATSGSDLVSSSLEKLGKHVEALTSGFNLQSTQRLLLAPEHAEFSISGVERVADLNALCTRLREVMSGG